jgi:hypothetical protein
MSNPFDRNQLREARLGEIITDAGSQNQRDAVHIAVVPVKASWEHKPGERMGVSDDGTRTDDRRPIGIVDPFLTAPVKEGQTFWLFLFQGSVTTLRHEWTHPAFPSIGRPPTSARERMERFAWLCRQGYDELIEATGAFLASGDSIHAGDNEGIQAYPEFWQDYMELTGTQVKPDQEGPWFWCAC